MANEDQSTPEQVPANIHCADVVDAPNRYGIRSTVHLCVALDHKNGDAVQDVIVHLDQWSFSHDLADEFRRNPSGRSRVEGEIARSAASEYLRGDRSVQWRGARLD